jgi:pyrophosphate--fructose-6-phosphate 1-phosphotransferase
MPPYSTILEVPMSISPLQKARLSFKPQLPAVLALKASSIALKKGKPSQSVADQAKIKALFPQTYGQPEVSFAKGKSALSLKPLNVGVVLSGGQAPGGHNVVSGLFDGLKKLNKKSRLFGFLGGPSGISDNKFIEITAKLVDAYRNTGGFDIIGSGRTKLETEEQFKACEKNMKALGITALVVVGGDDSNTNAAVLAEYFAAKQSGIRVIGAPKTIDGDLKNEQIETSFGFDTATKVYSELIGNVSRDCLSAKKYWHFIKLMGRSASHIALECGLKTQPNVTLISEEVAEKKQTLAAITAQIATIVAERAGRGKNYGIVLIPEGLLEFIPEMKALIAELNDLLAHDDAEYEKLPDMKAKAAHVASKLGAASKAAFASLPEAIQGQLLADRDPHGNVQVSRIETEQLLMASVGKLLGQWAKEGKSKAKFSPLPHFFGYEGRAVAPSNFDANYCYALGYAASMLVASGLTGYLASARGLLKKSPQWIAGGVPLTMMMNVERRHGADKPVIRKALVELEGKPFKFLAGKRAEWAKEDAYQFPGAIQYWGPSEVADLPTETLKLEK